MLDAEFVLEEDLVKRGGFNEVRYVGLLKGGGSGNAYEIAFSGLVLAFLL